MEDQKTLGQVADDYGAPRLKNVAELESINIEMEIKEDLDATYPFKYVEVDGEKYKVPVSVISAIKDIRTMEPTAVKFKVKQSGEGMKTKYTVVPLF